MSGHEQRFDLLDTPEMNVLFLRLDRLNEGQLLALKAAWHAVSQAEHEEAWAAVRAVIASEGLDKEIDRVRGAALAWTNRASDIAPYSTSGRPDRMLTQIKREAGAAVVDAALATALGARLDGAAYDTMMGPWRSALDLDEPGR